MKKKNPSSWYILVFTLNVAAVLFATISYFLSFYSDTVLTLTIPFVLLLRGLWIQGQLTIFENTKGNERYNTWFSILSIGFIGIVISGAMIYLISPNDLYSVGLRHYLPTSIIMGITIVAGIHCVSADLKRSAVTA
jgi:hypothetical protein